MEDKLPNLFSSTANSLNVLFKESVAELEHSKVKGKKDLYQESLKWMIDSHDGDLKFVRIEDFLQYLRTQNSTYETAKVIMNNKKYKPCND